MYLDHFQLVEPPFSIAPDPRYLYLSASHAEALAHLTYGLHSQDGGIVVLTGEVGTGKTTICRRLLERVPDSCDVAFIFNPRLSIPELLSTLCDELRIDYPPNNRSTKLFIDRINRRLLASHAAGRKTVLIIDEAQQLGAGVLEQLRLLTNLETNDRKLLQIILLGQPELAERLAQPGLRQLAQRIVTRYHLEQLDADEVAACIQHRLRIAGGNRRLFPPAVISQLVRLSGGTPRLINLICDRALLGAYAHGLECVDRKTLLQAAGEVLGKPGAARRGKAWYGSRTAVLGLVVGAALALVALWQLFDLAGPGTALDSSGRVAQLAPGGPPAGAIAIRAGGD